MIGCPLLTGSRDPPSHVTLRKMTDVLYQIQRVAQTIPVIIIMSIVLWSYYAFVVSLCGVLPSPELKSLYLIVYHVVFISFMWSYLRAIFSDSGAVPPQFYLTASEKEGLERSPDPRIFLESVGQRLPIHEVTLTNSVRYCEVCVAIKPDRAHHCSMCRRCVLKMDHHCPWINNCVGFRNYKFFTTFLLYSCVYTITVSLFVAPWAVFIWNRVPEMNQLPEMTKFNIMIVFFVATMFFLAVAGLWVFHAFLTANNKSTLEMGRAPRFKNQRVVEKNPYDKGCNVNCRDVYGKGTCMLCPVYTSRGNGVLFQSAEAPPGDMRRLLSSNGMASEDEEIVYNSDVPLNLTPVMSA